MKNHFYIFISLYFFLFYACKTYPKHAFVEKNSPNIDYSNLDYWAAHPDKEDPSDLQPGDTLLANQRDLPVDVFFIHPTTYWNNKAYDKWNAPIDFEQINDRTDETTIKYQASIFNNVGRVYAPRYRQAHLQAYLTKDTLSGDKALKKAYQDVEKAFKYYLENFNNGRPFIIASHSQGTTHAGPLMKKYIDGKAIQDQFIAAYVVGLPVPMDYFEHIPPCESPEQTNCMISWRSFKKNAKPSKKWVVDYPALNTNPLTWRIDGEYAEAELNKGGVMRDFNTILPNLVDAQVKDNLLFVKKPKFPFSFLFREKNYHIIDLNLFYVNIKENAQLRVSTYLKEKGGK